MCCPTIQINPDLLSMPPLDSEVASRYLYTNGCPLCRYEFHLDRDRCKSPIPYSRRVEPDLERRLKRAQNVSMNIAPVRCGSAGLWASNRKRQDVTFRLRLKNWGKDVEGSIESECLTPALIQLLGTMATG
jgi:hypothetical protein